MRILESSRAQYQRTFNDGDHCVFCAGSDVLECPELAGQFWRVLVNRFPYMDGNVMIVPKRHVEQTVELTPEEWADFGLVLKATQVVLTKIFKTESFNIGMNLGQESGASIAHLHWQVVPRKFKNVTVMNTFADLYVIKVTAEETQRLIKEALS
jgi:ATP adenylyltransferase